LRPSQGSLTLNENLTRVTAALEAELENDPYAAGLARVVSEYVTGNDARLKAF
jgi:hypothetical protein